MRFLTVDTYYPAFLYTFYRQHPDLTHLPYAEQWRILMDQCFGTADFYSDNLKQLGYEASEIVANCEPLQRQWATERGLKPDPPRWTLGKRAGFIPWLHRRQDWLHPILAAQIKTYQPDVLHMQDLSLITPTFLREIKPYVRLITGQIASPIPPKTNLKAYDLILSSFPHFVDRFRQEGLASAYFSLGFEPKVQQKLRETKTPYQVVFVGGLSAQHQERIRFLEKLVKSHPISWWGYGINTLSSHSPLYSLHQGEAWGLDMYQVLSSSTIAINYHINVAGNYANNMRLYEATGVGTLLITDYKENLHTLFEPGKEVVAYHSAEECADLITYYLTHQAEGKAIARAGQARTLKEHTYYQRMQEFVTLIHPYLKMKLI